MTEDVVTKEQATQLVFNAEIRKDISFIRDSLGNLQNDLKLYAAQFVPNSTFIEYKKDVDKLRDDAEKAHDAFDKRIRFLERYAWAAIGIIGFVELAFEAYRTVHGQ